MINTNIICDKCGKPPEILERLSDDILSCYDVSKPCSCSGNWKIKGEEITVAYKAERKEKQNARAEKELTRKEIAKIQQDMQEKIISEFPTFIEKRKIEIVNEISDYVNVENIKGITRLVISEELFKPLEIKTGYGFDYIADDFRAAYDYLRYMVLEINKNSIDYVPNMGDVCKLLSISEKKFNNYRNLGASAEIREACELLFTYLYGLNDHASKTGRVEFHTHIFDSKATYGKKENDSIININNNNLNTDKSVDELMREYENSKKERE